MTQSDLHKIVWSRFMRAPYVHILDYADKNGVAIIPTNEECQQAKPNPLGWWTPIENGAFFTGLYTYALIEKYNKSKDSDTAQEVEKLIGGLYLLQDVAKTDGFIARGVADDGVSHYPVSSEDQAVPWMMALYAYYKCDLCRCKNLVKERLLRTLNAIKLNDWRLPTEEGGFSNSWADSCHWRSVVKIVFCARVIYELTGLVQDLQYYNKVLTEKPQDCAFSRGEIISLGYEQDMKAFLGTNQTWICTCGHLAVRELFLLDNENSLLYKTCLHNNGTTALAHTKDVASYDNERGGFDYDWRPINNLWRYYKGDIADGIANAHEQRRYWSKEIVPHRHEEHHTLGNGLFAYWVAVTCEDENIISAAAQKMQFDFDSVNWYDLHLPYAFVAESALIYLR